MSKTLTRGGAAWTCQVHHGHGNGTEEEAEAREGAVVRARRRQLERQEGWIAVSVQGALCVGSEHQPAWQRA